MQYNATYLFPLICLIILSPIIGNLTHIYQHTLILSFYNLTPVLYAHYMSDKKYFYRFQVIKKGADFLPRPHIYEILTDCCKLCHQRRHNFIVIFQNRIMKNINTQKTGNTYNKQSIV